MSDYKTPTQAETKARAEAVAAREITRLRGVLAHLLSDAKRALAWHNATGQKVAKTPELSHSAARYLIRTIERALKEPEAP